MKDIIGAEMWKGELICNKCGRFIRVSGKIGSYIQYGCYGEIYKCKCGNVVQVTEYEHIDKEKSHAG